MDNYGYSKDMPDDIRSEEWKKQREERGFDSTELWNLDSTIASFIAPRLKAFNENTHSSPGNLPLEDWKEILNEMILTFEYLSGDDKFDISKPHPDTTEGLQLFAQYFNSLWN